jgi:tRNA threonylcarbamoyladenosine modification (KEOPS) complex  Pcc1 subunit
MQRCVLHKGLSACNHQPCRSGCHGDLWTRLLLAPSLAHSAQLRPEAVTRQLSVEGSALVLNFAAVDMRTLRAAVGTFCDLLGLASRTLEAFGAGAPGLAAVGAAAESGTAAAAGGAEPAIAAAAAQP